MTIVYWKGQDPLNFNKEEWLEVLQDEDIFDKMGLEMVTFVYEQPNCQSSATEIGEALGGVSQQQVTAWNRRVARKIFIMLGKEPPHNDKGGKRYWNALFDGDAEHEHDEIGRFIWILRPSLVSALRQLHIQQDGVERRVK